MDDAARWVQCKTAKHKAGIGGPDLTGLGVLANDRNHLRILARSHKCGPYIGLEKTRIGRLIGDHIAIGRVGGCSDGVAEAGRQRKSKIPLHRGYGGLEPAIFLVVGSLTFHHFRNSRQGLVLVCRLACLGLPWIGLGRIGLGTGTKGLDCNGEAGCSKCQASTRCQWTPVGMGAQC